MNRAEVVHLTDGGTATFADTSEPGEPGRFRVTFDYPDGLHFSLPFSALDMRGLRDATGMLVLGNLQATA